MYDWNNLEEQIITGRNIMYSRMKDDPSKICPMKTN